MYVPNNAEDIAEMTFLTSTFFSPSAGADVIYTPAQQAAAFEQFINSVPCLSESRGRILERNACDAPWINTLNVSVRQSLRTFRMQHVTLQLDVFNFLNLLNKEWGLQSTPGTSPITLLTSGAYTGGTILTGRPTYRFNPNYQAYVSNNIRSNYQMQLQARYSF